MRLIDADVLMQFPIRLNHYDRVNGSEDYVFGVEAVLEYAENLPTIDAEPVVRCKDCQHWGTGYGGETDNIKVCEYANYMVGKNGYCVYGERKMDLEVQDD